mgnify:CR=1 FL=1
MADMKWYVLRAISGKETKVKEYIDAARANGAFGDCVGQVLVPTEKKVVQDRNGKRSVADRILFSGYVYVQAIMVGEIAHALRNVPNVVGILGGLDNPAPIRQSEADRLLNASIQEPVDLDATLSFVVGEQVKVTEGPFSSFNGIVSEVNAERKRLTVLVKVFGRETALSLGFGEVEKL